MPATRIPISELDGANSTVPDKDLKRSILEEKKRQKITAKRKHSLEEFPFSTAAEEPEVVTNYENITVQESTINSIATSRHFAVSDQLELNHNEHHRFVPAAHKVSHALISYDEEELVAAQFAPPSINCGQSVWRPLINVHELEKNGEQFFRAVTPDHLTPMLGRRSVKVDLCENGVNKNHTLVCFSPIPAAEFNCEDSAAEISYNTRTKSMPFSKDGKHLALSSLNKKVKYWPVRTSDVIKREKIKRRRAQKDVMGKYLEVGSHRAQAEGAIFLHEYADILHEHRVRFVLDKNLAAEDQHHGYSEKAQWRFEWVHAMARSLAPLDRDPQTADNLAAAPKWINTQMRILERTAKWIAENRPAATINGECIFYIIPNTEILERGKLKFTITENERTLELEQDLVPHQENPSFNKPSDVWQTTMVAVYLLLRKMPQPIEPAWPSTVGVIVAEIADFICRLLGLNQAELQGVQSQQRIRPQI
jgi:hypothetical protein